MIAIDIDSSAHGSNVEIARTLERGCTMAEAGIAQQHAGQNHTLPIPGSVNTLEPHVTSCHVSNGYIVSASRPISSSSSSAERLGRPERLEVRG